MELGERYGQSSNAQLFSLQKELNNLVQTPNMKIAEFFTKIKTLWDELDGLNPLPTCSCPASDSCVCDIAKKCFKMQQNNRVISFLMRLDKRYSQVRSNILMMVDLLTSAQAYKILLQEETHLELSTTETNDSLACKVEKRKKRGYGKSFGKPSKAKKQQFYCDHCEISGHTKDRCWKIVGYPSNFKGNTWRRNNEHMANNAVKDQSTGTGEELVTAKFTNTQYQKILDMLNKETSHANTTVTNQSENSVISCLSFLGNDDWIIDSGDSDHMCFNLDKFTSYNFISDKGHMITVPDGRKITVKYMGTVRLQNDFTLLNVLYVPQFRFNLISVSKLLDDLKCKLSFDHHDCHIQESLMKKHWLLGISKSGLYVFEGPRSETSESHEENQKLLLYCSTKEPAVSSLLNKAKL